MIRVSRKTAAQDGTQQASANNASLMMINWTSLPGKSRQQPKPFHASASLKAT